MTSLDYAWAENATVLQLKANLANGWQRLTKTYGFYEQLRFEFRTDIPIRVSLGILPRPSGFVVRSLPDIVANGDSLGIAFQMRKQTLLLNLKMFSEPGTLNPNLPWRNTEKGNLSIFYMVDQIASVASARLEMQLNVVFLTPPGPPPPVIRDFSSKMPSAGLPSLGKRR